MSKKKLKKALKRAEKLRDQWCEEYTYLRDKLLAIRSKLARISDDVEGGAA